MERFLKNIFSLLMLVTWLTTGFDTFGKENNVGPKQQVYTPQMTTEKNPLGDMEDSHNTSSNETDKEIEEDDDSSVIQHKNSILFATIVNLIYVFQSALYKEQEFEVASPPPQS
ncbi:MAG: hypothetical protein AABY93_04705 [Bacteroidota bacterium]